ncbi:MAG: PKD domain-containing protein [Euryarchaeota archaeon]|nr:PKD domain-containing protein [Euryarchaeota archaeon]MDE1837090.1 PKD domain-containing protein [Euryarchaeota archaeon]MDE2045224.1 PKD domain-containing protein [Thermoplasmata archaeon]
MWNFGDGGFSTSPTPRHTFSLAGSFRVALIVNDSVGGTSSSSVTVQVAQALAVTGSAAPATTDVGSAVAFGGFAAQGTGASTFSWTFGDGSSATGRYANHTYSAPGTFTATLTATDTQGRTGTSVVVVTVSADPTVSLVASPSSLTLGGLVTFSASAAGGTGSLSYSWTGLPAGCASSNSATIVCRPTVVGNSSVKVVVSDSLGVTSSATSTVNVGAKPTLTTSLFGASGISGELALIAVVAILGLLLLVLLLRNRRGGGKPSAGGTGGPSKSSDDVSEPTPPSASAPSPTPGGPETPLPPVPASTPVPPDEGTEPDDYHES